MTPEERRDPTVTSLILKSIDELKSDIERGFAEINGQFAEINRKREGEARESGANRVQVANHEDRIKSLEKWRIATLAAALSAAGALILFLVDLLSRGRV